MKWESSSSALGAPRIGVTVHASFVASVSAWFLGEQEWRLSATV